MDIERVMWLRCYGIPTQDWNHEVFLSLIGGMGEYLCVDDNTRECIKLDVA